MENLINKLIETAFGQRARWFWATMIIIVILVLILFPYIDANFMAYSRINQRVELLEKITNLDIDVINNVPELKGEYDSILSEINNSRENSITQISKAKQSSPNEYWIKFFSGGSLFFIVSIFLLFGKGKEKEETKRKRIFNKFMTFIVCVFIGYLLGLLATNIPTFMNVWVNAISFPLFYLLLLLLHCLYMLRKIRARHNNLYILFKDTRPSCNA